MRLTALSLYAVTVIVSPSMSSACNWMIVYFFSSFLISIFFENGLYPMYWEISVNVPSPVWIEKMSVKVGHTSAFVLLQKNIGADQKFTRIRVLHDTGDPGLCVDIRRCKNQQRIEGRYFHISQ
jgi:hypothetical protein